MSPFEEQRIKLPKGPYTGSLRLCCQQPSVTKILHFAFELFFGNEVGLDSHGSSPRVSGMVAHKQAGPEERGQWQKHHQRDAWARIQQAWVSGLKSSP